MVNQEPHSLRIAVAAGGSDPYGLMHEIAKIFGMLPEQLQVYLFSNTNLDSVLDNRFRYIEVGQQLDELTRNIDLVLTTASTSSLEFLARGLCVGIACAVDNQEQYYNSLGKLGVTAKSGFRNLDNKWELDEKLIYSLIISIELGGNLIGRAKSLIDFKGASRIVDAITNL